MSVQALDIWVSIYYMNMFFCSASLKWWHFQMFFPLVFLFILVLWVVKRGGDLKDKNGPKFCLTSYLRNCTSYDCGFWYTWLKWYLQQIFSFFPKSDFSGFSKFINKFQKKIMVCAQPFSHVCDFFVKL